MLTVEAHLSLVDKKISDVLRELRKLNEIDNKDKINEFQRKMLRNVFTELMTPFKLDITVEQKAIKKMVEDAFVKNIDVSKVIMVHSNEIDKINQSLLAMLKNTSQENQGLSREINRLHKIDRLKVAQANTSIMLSDHPTFTPNLDLFRAYPASCHSVPPDLAHSIDKLREQNNGTSTHRNVVTANEISGVCERSARGMFTGQPSQRHRVVIARSQEQATRPKPKPLRNQVFNINNVLNSTRKTVRGLNDSLMSTTTGNE